MTKLIPFVAAIMIMFGTYTAPAQDTSSLVEEIQHILDHAELFTHCTPMGLSVTLTEEKTGDLGLTKGSVENAVESRLRAARLFTEFSLSEKGDQYLEVNITGIGSTFGLELDLKRALKDTGFGLPGIVAVWDRTSVGRHGGDGQYILGTLSKSVDEFLAKYLRVNEEACAKK